MTNSADANQMSCSLESVFYRHYLSVHIFGSGLQSSGHRTLIQCCINADTTSCINVDWTFSKRSLPADNMVTRLISSFRTDKYIKQNYVPIKHHVNIPKYFDPLKYPFFFRKSKQGFTGIHFLFLVKTMKNIIIFI